MFIIYLRVRTSNYATTNRFIGTKMLAVENNRGKNFNLKIEFERRKQVETL